MNLSKKWNNLGFYEIKRNNQNIIVELETILTSDILDISNKKYVKIQYGDFKKEIDEICRYMNYVIDNEDFLIKLIYRYSKYKTIFEKSNNELATSFDIKKGESVRVLIELKGAYDNRLYWNVLKIIIRNN